MTPDELATLLKANDEVDRLGDQATKAVKALEAAIQLDMASAVKRQLESLADYIHTGGNGSAFDWRNLQQENEDTRAIIGTLIPEAGALGS